MSFLVSECVSHFLGMLLDWPEGRDEYNVMTGYGNKRQAKSRSFFSFFFWLIVIAYICLDLGVYARTTYEPSIHQFSPGRLHQ